jgi:hypothetical protein
VKCIYASSILYIESKSINSARYKISSAMDAESLSYPSVLPLTGKSNVNDIRSGRTSINRERNISLQADLIKAHALSNT